MIYAKQTIYAKKSYWGTCNCRWCVFSVSFTTRLFTHHNHQLTRCPYSSICCLKVLWIAFYNDKQSGFYLNHTIIVEHVHGSNFAIHKWLFLSSYFYFLSCVITKNHTQNDGQTDWYLQYTMAKIIANKNKSVKTVVKTAR